MAYGRRSGNDLAYGEDNYPERWDRDRFDRMRNRGPPRESDSFRYEEDDRYGPRGGYRRDIEVDDRYTRYGPRGGGYTERDRFYEDDRYAPFPRSRQPYLDDDRDRNYVSQRQVAPYRPRYEEDYDISYKRTSRPGMLRRQSSWDAHDRPPPTRYGRDDEQDVNVTVNLTGPGSSAGPPPRRDYDDYRDYREPYRDPYRTEYLDEDYRDVRIRRERERSTYRRSGDYDSRRSGDYDSRSNYEEYDEPPRRNPRRGKTKMPKRLVHRKAIIDLGYPFEEEEDFYYVRIALSKDQIDEVIKISEIYFREEKYSYSATETKMLEAPPPPQTEEITEKITTRVIENPTQEEYERYVNRASGQEESVSVRESFHESRQGGTSESVHASIHNNNESDSSTDTERESGHASRSRRRRRRRRSNNETTVVEERSEPNIRRNNNNLEIVVPIRNKSRRRESDIKAEIKALEDEKRNIKDDRDRPEIEIVNRRDYERGRDTRDVLVVEKDSRGKSKSRTRKSSNKLAEAALLTLT